MELAQPTDNRTPATGKIALGSFQSSKTPASLGHVIIY